MSGERSGGGARPEASSSVVVVLREAPTGCYVPLVRSGRVGREDPWVSLVSVGTGTDSMSD